MQLKRLAAAGALAVGLSGVIGAGSASAAASPEPALTIAGSSLVAPLAQIRYNAWSYLEDAASTTVGAGGSSTGIEGICDASGAQVSIGDSDAPLGSNLAGTSPTGLNANCANAVYQIPWAATGTGVAYHIKGVGKNLHLNGSVIYKIISGKITNWDNKAIQSLNMKTVKVHGKKKKVDSPKLPNLAITLVYRNGSGDTYAFENYLKHDNAGVPSSDAVSTSFWTPTPSTAVLDSGGNTGMIDNISSTNGAFGYIAVPVYIQDLYNGAANTSGVDFAALQNAAGNYEPPNYANIQAAVDARTSLPAQGSGFGMTVVDPSSKYKTAYPLATYTYADVLRNSGSSAAEIKSFLTYSVSTKFEGSTGGANLDESIFYIGLPTAVQNADKSLISKISGS